MKGRTRKRKGKSQPDNPCKLCVLGIKHKPDTKDKRVLLAERPAWKMVERTDAIKGTYLVREDTGGVRRTFTQPGETVFCNVGHQTGDTPNYVNPKLRGYCTSRRTRRDLKHVRA